MNDLVDKKENNIGLIVLNLTLIGLVFSFSLMLYRLKSGDKIVTESQKQISQKIKIDQSKIKAKSVIVYDINDEKVLYEKNSDEKLPLASLVKIMTVYTARSLADTDEVISVKKEDLSEEGDNGLLVGEKWKLKDISDFSLIVSSNDGARMIASAIGSVKLGKDNPRDLFISKMNELSSKLGLNTLHFNNETGLDKDDSLGGVGSAKDLAKLIAISLSHYPDIFDKTSSLYSDIHSFNTIHNASNTNSYVDQISGILASKTGFTDKAGGNLMTVFNVGLAKPIAVVVLGSTVDGRFEDMSYIASTTINQIANIK